MKRLIRNNIYATSNLVKNKIMFTPEDIIALLSEIEQLNECKISYTETKNGLRLTINDYVYEFSN